MNKRIIKEITMRHEEKFICSQSQMVILENRIKHLLSMDKHQEAETYRIRSLYFDTFNDRFLEESLQGISNRSKFRIRTYNNSCSLIRLEKKISIGPLKKKESCLLSKPFVEQILKNKTNPTIQYEDNVILQEFFILQRKEKLKPKIIVEYDRSAYVNHIGNIRITFDKQICACQNVGDFFVDRIIRVPIMPRGYGIIEVKYDGILPGYIVQALNIGTLQRVSFSKYSLCRNIIRNNGNIEEYYEF